MTNIIVAGGPKTGKTTAAMMLAGVYNVPTVRHTDDLIEGRDWEAITDEVSRWFDDEGPWIVEGVVIPHALVKWFGRYSKGKPADLAIFLQKTHTGYTPQHVPMTKGCQTVWNKVLPLLSSVGCVVEYRS